MYQIITEVHPRPPEVDQVSSGWDDSLWDLCKDCWHTDPAKRPIVRDVIPRVSRFGQVVPNYYIERKTDLPQRFIAGFFQTPEQAMAALPDGNLNSWPMPAFCKVSQPSAQSSRHNNENPGVKGPQQLRSSHRRHILRYWEL